MQRNQRYKHLPAKVISLVSTLMLLIPLIIFPVRQVIFSVQTGRIKHLETTSGKLEKMVFSVKEFDRLNFTRSEREFIYDGNMFDVHSITRSGNHVVVLALWDKQDTGILLACQNEESRKGSAMPAITAAGFMPYFCMDTFRPDFRQSWPAPSHYPGDFLNYSDPYALICSPPPESLT
ncbi:MAG: hypothetical protein WC699_09485 [Bacteroidales bacterium]